MNKSQEQLIHNALITWGSFGGRVVNHTVLDGNQNEYEELVALGYMKKAKRLGQIEVYAVTREGFEALSDKMKYRIETQLEAKRREAKANKRFNHIDNYVYERQSPFYHTIENDVFCRRCFFTAKSGTCPNCGNDMNRLDVRARLPRKNASKQKWKEFLEMFQPEVLKNPNWWKDRNKLI